MIRFGDADPDESTEYEEINESDLLAWLGTDDDEDDPLEDAYRDEITDAWDAIGDGTY